MELDEIGTGESMAWMIYIVGPCRVNNELLASFLEAKVEAKCVTKGTIDDVLDLRGQEADNPKLVLLDCFAKDPERLFLEVESCHLSASLGGGL